MRKLILCIAHMSLMAACATQMPVPEQLTPITLGPEGSATITFTRLIVRVPAGSELGHHHDGLLKVQKYTHTWGSNLTVASDEFKIIASEPYVAVDTP